MERDALVAKLEETVGDLQRAAAVDVASFTLELASVHTKVGQLETAIEHRTVLGQATGVVMTRFGLVSGAAFKVLAQLSQDTNRKVYDIAREIVELHDAEVAEAQTGPELAVG